MIDSHCHLDDEAFREEIDSVVQRAIDAGVTTMLTIDAPTEFLDRHSALVGSVGVHPHEAGKASAGYLDALRERASHPKVLAIGEIGLDYHYDFAPRDVQREVFIQQLKLAEELGKPIIIHTREAWDDTFETLDRHWRGQGIMHCFSGGPTEAERCLKMDFHLAFGGVITFPKAVDIQAAAAMTPSDQLLLETDAPYLAPVPKRGKRNEPALMVHTAVRLAELRNSTVADVDHVTSANFRRLFSLD